MKRGDAIAIMGPSGSGKSTLLYILGALETPTSGRVTLDGVDPNSLSEKAAAEFRNRRIGFVFQDHCLLPQCSVLENVLTPTLVSPVKDQYEQKARSLLDAVGLGTRLDHRPAELSGGEKQRVAIARSLIHEPVLLLCDEPTGNLDHRSAQSVANLLLELQRRNEAMVVVVTHSIDIAARFPVRYEMIDQKLVRSA